MQSRQNAIQTNSVSLFISILKGSFFISFSERPWVWPVVMNIVFVLGMLYLFLYLSNIDVSDGVHAVKDAGDFLKRRSFRFDVEEVYEA